LLGSGWLLMKTEGDLQRRAVKWARNSLWITAIGVAGISAVTPLVSQTIFNKWFALPQLLWLSPIPLLTIGLLFFTHRILNTLPRTGDAYCWVPFATTVGVFVLAFLGLAYSMFPYLVIDKINIWEAASAPESLIIILVGALVVLPAILAYTVFAYRVFHGKATHLSYE
jgi:cytochrome bd ubiquinol oxidase subunit II